MKALIYIGIAFFVSACGTKAYDTNEIASKTETISVDVLFEGEMGGGGSEGIEQGLIELMDLGQFKELRNKVNSDNTGDMPPIELDFNNYRYFFYADKVRPRLQYSIEVSEAGHNDAMQTVHFLFSSIQPVGPTGERLSQPYIVFSIKQCKGDVKFTSREAI